ncbi:MAG: C4-dicarboxylate ABC transporter, partial [Polaromonas sp.]|nr:C4-dicarboxylate ABC transporter [Polaromonas sp.]
GLIIAFPGIVSSGLDKKQVYDMDKVRIEMENSMPAAEPATDPFATTPESPASDPTSGMPAPEAAPAAETDPMKALEEAAKKK